jgi:hypothetical protein
MSTGADAGPRTPSARKKAPLNTEANNTKPRMTAKRLPWLDSKDSGIAVTPQNVLSSDASSLSPSTRHATRRPSVAGAPKRTTLSQPSARRKAPAVQTKAESSPSPATRHQLSQSRRPFLLRKPPPQITTSHRPSVSRGPQKRLSTVQIQDSELEEDNLGGVRPRVDSVAPVSDHLQRSDSSDSMFKRETISSTSPANISRVQLSPSQPAPTRAALERVANRRVGNAVEGLGDMVQEAVDIVDNFTDPHHVEDIYKIVEDARIAIQAAIEDPARHLMVTTLPLEISSPSGEIEDVRVTHHEARSGTPRIPASFDWAYAEKAESPSSTSTSSSSYSGQRDETNFSSQSDLLLPPQPIQPMSRDHVDFVLRPITRDHSRGRSRKRVNGDSTVRARRQRRRQIHEERSHSRSRHRHLSSSISGGDTSFDDEDIRAHAYGNELTFQGQAHQHTFNLRRHHRRQPIARNWTTCKKRLTATIACINTALLGIIVGIYVSEPLAQECAQVNIAQAGEVPRIQYYLADENHHVIVGNAV